MKTALIHPSLKENKSGVHQYFKEKYDYFKVKNKVSVQINIDKNIKQGSV